MELLFAGEGHEPLRNEPWDAAAARAAIAGIAADAEAAFDPRAFWPAHPLDDLSGYLPPAWYSLYFGAAGVVWALERLRRDGLIALDRSYGEHLPEILRRNREQLRPIVPDCAGLLGGDAGILLADALARPRSDAADELLARIRDNVRHPSGELMLGAPGTLLAALACHEATGDARFAGAARATVAALRDAWREAGPGGCKLWRQDFLGQRGCQLGLLHGFAGNAAALLRARPLLDPAAAAEIEAGIRRTAVACAVARDGLANWPGVAAEDGGPRSEDRARWLVQVCHGAPGMPIGLARLPVAAAGDPEGDGARLESLLRGAGELVWRAGPLAKGPGLCHGTAGNGYALLALHARTGEALWLDRARAFAMHAIGQVRAQRRRYGRGRWSLWTGDLGVALFLSGCLRGDAAFPTIDAF